MAIRTSLSILGSAIISLSAAELPSGNALLERIERERNENSSKTNKVDSPRAELRRGLTNFIAQRATLEPAVAAEQWLKLVDSARTMSSTLRISPAFPLHDPAALMDRIRPEELLSALPEPAAWPELEKAVDKREIKTGADFALRAITARLVNRLDKASAAIDAFAKKAPEEEVFAVEALRESLARAGNRTKEDLLKELNRLVAASARGEADDATLPRLTPTLSEAEAEEALKKALPKIKVAVHSEDYRESDYIWKAALAVVDQLPIPQWALVNSPNAAPLYEALEKKFGASANEEESEEDALNTPARGGIRFYRSGQAKQFYIMGLIRNGEISKAVQITLKSKVRDLYIDPVRQGIPAGRLADFYFELLKNEPTRDDWDELTSAAAKAGRTAEVLALAEASVAKPDLTDAQRAQFREVIAKAKLADDRIDEGLAALREGVANKNRDLAMQFALLGAALKRPELLREAIELEKKKTPGLQTAHYLPAAQSSLALLVSQQGLVNEGFDLAAKSLSSSKSGGSGALAILATIYIQQGRAAEALALLEKSPDWGMADVSKALSQPNFGRHGYEVRPLPLGYIAAAALAAAGREDEALKVLQAFLNEEGGNDRAYELLLKIAGPKTKEILNGLLALDQFEERPLIWRAVIEQREGKLDEAEKTIRAAIAIDPSDGEQGPGDRLRAYAVLAEILAAKGDQKQADFLRGAVKAIRLSEEADLDFAAGLLRRAINKYKESLKLFADAYCVQARLAVQMAALGLNEEAEEHYRRAFELMPDSFGRVESHCFGCEGSFGGERAQNIAEKVFNDLLQKSPEKPQLHYLLGYLRTQQERHADALPHFRQAVKLDPDYLNAWKKILELSEHVNLTADEEDEASINVVRLDPLGRQRSYHTGNVNDLARLWKAAAEAAAKIPEKPARLLPLPASAEQLKKRTGDLNFGGSSRFERYFNGSERGVGKNPADVIARDQTIVSVSSYLIGQGY